MVTRSMFDRTPEPRRGKEGSNILGPRNPARERQEPDTISPPKTDHGTLPNMKWSFADSHMHLEEGGWARQTTVRELPTSVELAGVNMRLEEGAYRELHWHQEAEWAYMLEGRCRVTVLDVDGGMYEDEVGPGDLWYFPTGNPHSLQGVGKGGCEFLLIFDNGNFSEEGTFLLTDYFAHMPKSVLAKNFGVPESVLDDIPKSELYIFPGTLPGPLPPKDGPHASKRRFTHRMLEQVPKQMDGGSVRIADIKNFPMSKNICAAHVTIEPGAMRALHWHPNADEWSFFIRGKARVTVFGSTTLSRTFNYVAGDVGIVPKNYGHYVENIGDEPIEMLEIFRAGEFQDFSTEQWLALSSNTMVKEHLKLTDANARIFLKSLSKDNIPIKPDNPNK